MKFIALFTVVVLLMGAVVVSAEDSKPNFSGEWVLNVEKSDQGGDRGGARGGRRGGMMAAKMNIEQKDNQLVVESFRKNRDGEDVSTKATYTLDGKKCKNDTNFGTRESTANWSKDGKMLTIESTMNMSRGDREFTMNSTEKWSLDKNVLTIETTRSTPRGERTSKAVYDKVEKKK
jgi:hypothetical protein